MGFAVDENEFVAAQQDLDVLLPAAGAGGCQEIGRRSHLVLIGPPSVQQVVQPGDGRDRIGSPGDPVGQQVGPADDEGAVEHEQLLKRGDGADPLGTVPGRGREVIQPEHGVELTAFDFRVERTSSVTGIVDRDGAAADGRIEFSAGRQHRVPPRLDREPPPIHPPQPTVVRIDSLAPGTGQAGLAVGGR